MTHVYIDVETTGLDPINCSIFQIAGIIKKGDMEEKFNFLMKPYHYEKMTDYAKEKTKMTDEIIATYPDQSIAFKSFVDLLNKYINVDDYNDRAFFIGYNSSFDSDFVREWFRYNNYDKYSSYFWFPYIDVMAYAGITLIGERQKLRNFQLSTVYKYVTGKVLSGAHNAFADIEATRELLNALFKRNKEMFSSSSAPSIPTREIPVRKIS